MINLVRVFPRATILEIASKCATLAPNSIHPQSPEFCDKIQKEFGKWILISISGTRDLVGKGDKEPVPESVFENLAKAGMQAVLRLKFDDVEASGGFYGSPTPSDLTPPNREHAVQIIEFVKEWENKVDTLVTHCWGGVSRSGAVGKWANTRFGLNDFFFKVNHPHVNPNATLLSWLTYLSDSRNKE